MISSLSKHDVYAYIWERIVVENYNPRSQELSFCLQEKYWKNVKSLGFKNTSRSFSFLDGCKPCLLTLFDSQYILTSLCSSKPSWAVECGFTLHFQYVWSRHVKPRFMSATLSARVMTQRLQLLFLISKPTLFQPFVQTGLHFDFWLCLSELTVILFSDVVRGGISNNLICGVISQFSSGWVLSISMGKWSLLMKISISALSAEVHAILCMVSFV